MLHSAGMVHGCVKPSQALGHMTYGRFWWVQGAGKRPIFLSFLFCLQMPFRYGNLICRPKLYPFNVSKPMLVEKDVIPPQARKTPLFQAVLVLVTCVIEKLQYEAIVAKLRGAGRGNLQAPKPTLKQSIPTSCPVARPVFGFPSSHPLLELPFLTKAAFETRQASPCAVACTYLRVVATSTTCCALSNR